jgi:hypothetical protein
LRTTCPIVADHRLRNAELHHTAILSSEPRYMDHIIREATEIELHPHVMNRQDGVCLSEAWKPPICSLKDRRKPPSHDSRSGFSAEPRRSVHITFIRAQNMPSPAAHQPPTLMSRLPSATSAPSSPFPTVCLRLTHLTFLPYTSVTCPTHFSVFFLDRQNSCYCLLLLPRRANGN